MAEGKRLRLNTDGLRSSSSSSSSLWSRRRQRRRRRWLAKKKRRWRDLWWCRAIDWRRDSLARTQSACPADRHHDELAAAVAAVVRYLHPSSNVSDFRTGLRSYALSAMIFAGACLCCQPGFVAQAAGSLNRLLDTSYLWAGGVEATLEMKKQTRILQNTCALLS